MLSVIPQLQYSLTQTDVEILEVLHALSFVTAEQLSRLFYNAQDQNRYSQRRLKRLVDGGYVIRLRALPAPRQGSAPHVFALSNPGRRTLANLGIPASHPYVRPSEQKTAALNQPFLEHTLSCVDVLVAALRLTRGHSNVSLKRMLTERELKRNAPHVTLPTGAVTAVIPDAFLVLQVVPDPPIAIALEVDRGTEDQKRWRAKVASITAWAKGAYQERFGLDNITIAVVAPDRKRVDQLIDWTRRELEKQDALPLSEIFLFTATSPRMASPTTWFLSPVWQPFGMSRPVSLLLDGGAVP